MKWKNNIADSFDWNDEISNLEEKQELANKVSQFVKDGDVIGAGSGSTSYLALCAIGKRIKEENLHITVIPTSSETALNCVRLGIPQSTLMDCRPDWGFDGADEADDMKRLIKGRGGAMLAEKLVMASSRKTFILLDKSKRVNHLGAKFPVPVETDPRAIHLVEENLQHFSPVSIQLRRAEAKDGPIITESGNVILDVRFEHIPDNFEHEVKQHPWSGGNRLVF